MTITITIDKVNNDFDYIIDYIADQIKRGNTSGCAETDGCAYDWNSTND